MGAWSDVSRDIALASSLRNLGLPKERTAWLLEEFKVLASLEGLLITGIRSTVKAVTIHGYIG